MAGLITPAVMNARRAVAHADARATSQPVSAIPMLVITMSKPPGTNTRIASAPLPTGSTW